MLPNGKVVPTAVRCFEKQRTSFPQLYGASRVTIVGWIKSMPHATTFAAIPSRRELPQPQEWNIYLGSIKAKS